MMKKNTIKDVANYAGVSVGTVSRVINENKNVKPQIRQKVDQAIKELGYQPNSFARSLRTKQSKTVAFFVPDISNIAFSTIVKGLHQVLEEYEYNLILYNTGTKNVKEKLMDFFSTRKVDGAVLAINQEDDVSINKFLNELTIPFILLDREHQGVCADYIYTDYYYGIKSAVEYLVKLGHQNICFATGSNRIRPSRESVKGYLDALKLNDIEVKPDLVKMGDFTAEFGRESMNYFMKKINEKQATALIAGSYPILVGFLETIQKEGIRIPEDVSLVSFEDSDMARLRNPAITVIRRPLHDIGKKVAYFLLDRLSSGDYEHSPRSSMIVPTELIERSSVLSLKGGSQLSKHKR